MLSKKSIILAKAPNRLELGCKNFGWRLKTMQIYLLEIEDYLFLLDHWQIEDYFLLLEHWQTINFLVFFFFIVRPLANKSWFFRTIGKLLTFYYFYIVRPLADWSWFFYCQTIGRLMTISYCCTIWNALSYCLI